VKKRKCWDVKGRGGLYIDPESKFKQLWSIVIIVFLLYVAFLMPYSLAFTEDYFDSTATDGHIVTTYSSESYIDMIADFIFLIDVIVTLFSAYYDEKQGNLVTNNKQIVLRYVKGWFFIDLVASIPIRVIEASL
jgi:hypothetical protein